jgi:hypothetical protein
VTDFIVRNETRIALGFMCALATIFFQVLS